MVSCCSDFGVEFATASDDKVVSVRPLSRVESATGAIKGSFVAPSEGALRLVFDNGSAWFKSKHVKLSLKISPAVADPEA